MKIARLLPAFGIVAFVLLAGCRNGPERAASPEDVAERDSVLAVLQSTRQDALRDAFARLGAARYTCFVRTEQRDAAARLVAFAQRVVRHGSGPPTVLNADSAGTFDFGYLGRLVDAEVADRSASGLPQYVIPEDPPYLAPRHRDAYTYRLLPDTLLLGVAAQVVEVQARPGTDLNIRYARLYRDRRSSELMALMLERREHKLFFREDSRFFLQVRLAPEGGWLPVVTRVTARLDVPLRPPQTFRTVSAYYNVQQ
jgi:hypothetical protein